MLQCISTDARVWQTLRSPNTKSSAYDCCQELVTECRVVGAYRSDG